MKLAGFLLLLTAGYLLSFFLMEPEWHHIELLEEGEFLFRMIESAIRNDKTPLPQLFSEISQQTGSLWKDFFSELAAELEENNDFTFAEEFERLLLFYFSPFFTEEEQTLFYQMGRNLLSDDLLFHRNSLEQLLSKMEEHLSGMKEQANNKKKVTQALCLSASVLLTVFLI